MTDDYERRPEAMFQRDYFSASEVERRTYNYWRKQAAEMIALAPPPMTIEFIKKCLKTYDGDETMDTRAIAKIAHEINRNYRLAIGETPLAPWDDLESMKQAATIAGVNTHLEGLRIGEPVHPAISHENWCRDIAAIDPDHPNLVEYDELPVAQRAKDWIFAGIVKALREYGLDAGAPEQPSSEEIVRDPIGIVSDNDIDSIEWQTYIGTKIIKAKPGKHPDYADDAGSMDGYLVMYPDGYQSWSPKAVFEEAYRLLNKDERIMAGQSPAESSIMEITDDMGPAG